MEKTSSMIGEENPFRPLGAPPWLTTSTVILSAGSPAVGYSFEWYVQMPASAAPLCSNTTMPSSNLLKRCFFPDGLVISKNSTLSSSSTFSVTDMPSSMESSSVNVPANS